MFAALFNALPINLFVSFCFFCFLYVTIPDARIDPTFGVNSYNNSHCLDIVLRVCPLVGNLWFLYQVWYSLRERSQNLWHTREKEKDSCIEFGDQTYDISVKMWKSGIKISVKTYDTPVKNSGIEFGVFIRHGVLVSFIRPGGWCLYQIW